MIKKLISCTLLGGILVSCAPSHYKLTGSVLGFDEGDTIYLCKAMERHTLDSCIVKDGKFSFQGRQDSTILVTMKTMENGRLRMSTLPFYLENGKLVIKQDSIVWQCTGSTHNDIYQRYHDERKEHILEWSHLSFKMMEDDTLTDEQRKAYNARIKELEAILSSINMRHFEANLDNPVGLRLFATTILKYDIRKQHELTEHMHALWPEDNFVTKHKERVETQMETLVGEQFTDYTMQTPDGKQISLSEYVSQNKYTLVDIWASWCTPYPAQKPRLVEAYQKYKEKGLEIVGVSIDSDKAAWTSAIREWGMPWPQISDLKGWKSQATRLYYIEEIPYRILIDQNGVIVARNIQYKELDAVLGKFLK